MTRKCDLTRQEQRKFWCRVRVLDIWSAAVGFDLGCPGSEELPPGIVQIFRAAARPFQKDGASGDHSMAIETSNQKILNKAL